MKITIIIIKLLFLGALFIVSNQNLHLIDTDERAIFTDMYSKWISSLVVQGGEVTGYIVKFEWLPTKENDFYNSQKDTISKR